MDSDYKPGDIVQIIDAAHPWYPCLLIVSEVKSWGVLAHTLIPQSNRELGTVALAPNRLEYKTIAKVGTAQIVRGD